MIKGKIRYLLKSQKVYSTGGSVLNAVFGLVSFSVLARGLSKEEFGLWTVFLTVLGLFEMLRNGLVGSPLIKMSSGSDNQYFGDLVASALRLSLWFTLGSSVVVSIVYLIFYLVGDFVEYRDYVLWFVLCAFLAIPSSFGIWTSTAKIKFQRVVLLNGSRRLLFMLSVLIIFWLDLGLQEVFIAFTGVSLIVSIGSFIIGWTFLQKVSRFSAKYVKKMFDFGKYSMGTMLGGSALTSSDTFLIMFFMGPEAVAIYNVPMRIINLYDIPLRSLVQLAYPRLAKVKNQSGIGSFVKGLESSNGFAFLLLLPLSVCIFIFAEPIIFLIGGEDYIEASILLRVFCVYLVVTPLDRFAGIALDVLNRPNLNFRKMMLMVVINVIGDLVAIIYFDDIVYVAVASIITFGIGVIAGYYFLRDVAPFRLGVLLVAGLGEITKVVKRLLLK